MTSTQTSGVLIVYPIWATPWGLRLLTQDGQFVRPSG